MVRRKRARGRGMVLVDDNQHIYITTFDLAIAANILTLGDKERIELSLRAQYLTLAWDTTLFSLKCHQQEVQRATDWDTHTCFKDLPLWLDGMNHSESSTSWRQVQNCHGKVHNQRAASQTTKCRQDTGPSRAKGLHSHQSCSS